MSSWHDNFTGSFGRVTFLLDICDARDQIQTADDVRKVVWGAVPCRKADWPACIDFVEVSVDGQPLKGRAKRRCVQTLIVRLLQGDNLSIAYAGGWDSGGSAWGPNGEDLFADSYGGDEMEDDSMHPVGCPQCGGNQLTAGPRLRETPSGAWKEVPANEIVMACVSCDWQGSMASLR